MMLSKQGTTGIHNDRRRMKDAVLRFDLQISHVLTPPKKPNEMKTVSPRFLYTQAFW